MGCDSVKPMMDGVAMPCRAEAERAVLGSMLREPDRAVAAAQQVLRAEDFYVPAHRAVWSVLVDMEADGADLDAVTVASELQRRNLDEKLGGAPKLVADLYAEVPSAAHVRSYAKMVLEDSHRRQVMVAGQELMKLGADTDRDVDDLLDEVEGNLGGLRNMIAKAEIVPIREMVSATIEAIEAAHENRGKLHGIPTGFVDLDRMTGGLRTKTLSIFAARPSHGKSSLLGSILQNMAAAGYPTLFLSLEDEGVNLCKRMLSREGNVMLYRMKDGFMRRDDFPRLVTCAERLAKVPMWIDESAEMTIQQMRSRVRMMVRRHGIKVVGVDYLQLVKGSSKQARDNRALEVAEVAAGMKAMAKELDVAVLTAAQLGRGADDYERPKMSHLRESGGIENAADLIGLLVRPGKKKKDVEDDMAILEIAKQRDGATGDVNLLWFGEYTRFESEKDMDGNEKKLYG